MEDGLDFLKSKKVEHFFLTDEFNRYCPFYISLGMSYEQFWYGDPTMTKYYLKAYQQKEKREAEKAKWIMWEQGLYIYEAICDVSPILRAFSKSTKPLPYPKEPWGLDKSQEEKDKELQEKKKELDMYRQQIFFQNWAKAQKQRFQNKKQ
jgi:hypothetical protein